MRTSLIRSIPPDSAKIISRSVRRRRSGCLLAGSFLDPWSTLGCRKPCNIMMLTALQPTGCGPERARNRELNRTGTGHYQAVIRSEQAKNRRAKTGRETRRPGCKARPGFPFPAGGKWPSLRGGVEDGPIAGRRCMSPTGRVSPGSRWRQANVAPATMR